MVERQLLLIDANGGARETARALEREGFVVVHEHDVDPAVARLRRQAFDLAVIDAVLPGGDGFAACRMLRQADLLPVVMIAPVSGGTAVVNALEAGADDCVTKPFEMPELVARIRAVLHRHARTEPFIRAGRVEVDVEGFRAWKDGEELDLTATEFRLLSVLAARRGRVCSKQLLLSRVWHDGYGGVSRAIGRRSKAVCWMTALRSPIGSS
ncbi:MAG TPA: response regulator transcription factor [Actinomycetota bacterium]|nr:response regulator transcription factor [Actinomycetota bacterium]